jgi:hypothetical protein
MIIGLVFIVLISIIAISVVILIAVLSWFSRFFVGVLIYSGIPRRNAKKIARKIIRTIVIMSMDDRISSDITAAAEAILLKHANKSMDEMNILAAEYIVSIGHVDNHSLRDNRREQL